MRPRHSSLAEPWYGAFTYQKMVRSSNGCHDFAEVVISESLSLHYLVDGVLRSWIVPPGHRFITGRYDPTRKLLSFSDGEHTYSIKCPWCRYFGKEAERHRRLPGGIEVGTTRELVVAPARQ